MDFLKKKLDRKIGLPPGEISYTSTEQAEETEIVYRKYNKEEFSEIKVDDLDTLKTDDNFVNWIEITGFKDLDLIKKVGLHFNIHTMLLEDTLNVGHIPKYEEHEDYNVFITKAFHQHQDNNLIQNHICIISVGKTILVFSEFKSNFLDQKIERIKQAKGKARFKGSDYLFFVLLDAYVDSYYFFFDEIRDRLDHLEDKLLLNTSDNIINEIHDVKKELSSIRKNLIPLKECLNVIIKDEPEFISEKNIIYFKDIYDHVNDLIEHYNTFTEFNKSLVVLNDTNLNSNANKVMKVLTIIATIFIPLTFIAGLYGMNFKYMPELEFEYGYPVALGAMGIIGIIMFLYMKKKKWFD